jgi:uncharacterized protein YdiU (UPF0061 family)
VAKHGYLFVMPEERCSMQAASEVKATACALNETGIRCVVVALGNSHARGGNACHDGRDHVHEELRAFAAHEIEKFFGNTANACQPEAEEVKRGASKRKMHVLHCAAPLPSGFQEPCAMQPH